MRILFDHGTPNGLAGALPGHTVTTAQARGWDRLSNGDLLQAAEAEGFDLPITTDRRIRYQQNLTGRVLALVVLGNIGPVVRDHGAAIVAQVDAATPGSYGFIEMPLPPRRLKDGSRT